MNNAISYFVVLPLTNRLSTTTSCFRFRRMAEPVTDGNDNNLHRQLAIRDAVTPVSRSVTNSGSSSSPFSLPAGWIISLVPRSNGIRFDTYYIDPETRRRFRSLKDVERYLTGVAPSRSNTKRLNYHEEDSQKCSKQKRIVSSGKIQDLEENKDSESPKVNVTPARVRPASAFKLPAGWKVEEVPRKTGDNIDRYYYEPGTGHKFRSLTSVQKHLAELEDNSPLSVVLEKLRERKLPISKAVKLASPRKSHGSYDSRKKRIAKKDQDSSFSNAPPNKVNWVISSTPGESWNAYVDGKLVPDSVKQQWGKRFMSASNNTKNDEQE